MTNKIKWEDFNQNRKIIIRDKSSYLFHFEILNNFNEHQSLELPIFKSNKKIENFTSNNEIQNITTQINQLIQVLSSKEISYTTLQLCYTTLSTLKFTEFSPLKSFLE